jgi:hypothetical protein
MLRRLLFALVAATLALAAACSDDGAGTSGTAGDTSGVDQPAGGDTGTTDTTLPGSARSPDSCEQIAERPLTNDPVDAAEHYATLRRMLPRDLQDDAAIMEQAYRELADRGDAASALDEGGRTRTAILDLVEYQRAICFG